MFIVQVNVQQIYLLFNYDEIGKKKNCWLLFLLHSSKEERSAKLAERLGFQNSLG